MTGIFIFEVESALKAVVGMSAAQMGRAIIMPNLSPPVKSVRQAQTYRKKIMKALPTTQRLRPTHGTLSNRQTQTQKR